MSATLPSSEIDHYVLSDDHGSDIEFDGMLLASESSFTTSKERWSEYDLFQTVGGTYVVHVVGQSQEDDWERFAVHVIEDPSQIVHELSFPEMRCAECKTPGRNYCPTCNARTEFEPTGDRYVPEIVQDLLETASEFDPRISTRMVREIA